MGELDAADVAVRRRNIAQVAQCPQDIAFVDRLACVKKQLAASAFLRRTDFVLHLHGLHNDQHIARGHRIARLNEPLHHLRLKRGSDVLHPNIVQSAC